MQQLPLKIKKIREFRAYTQAYMAANLDLSQGAYSNIENGRTDISINRLKAIAELLDVDYMALLEIDYQEIFSQKILKGFRASRS